MIPLDRNIPATNEREVVRKGLSDLKLKMIPVNVLSTSPDECNIEAWNQEEGNSYIVKPVETNYL